MNLNFFSVIDDRHKVDAVAEIAAQQDNDIAEKIQRTLKGYGKFFEMSDGKKGFVLEGINLPEGNPSIGQRVHAWLTQQK